MSALRPITLPFLVIFGSHAAGCVTPPPGSEIEVLSTTPASIEIWGRNQVPNAIGPQPPWATDQQIVDLAQGHCRENGRDAQKVSQRIMGGARNVSFRCVAGDDMAVIGYQDVKDVPGFWVREWEAAADKAGANVRRVPEDIKRCAGEEMVKLSPTALSEAIERFIANQTAGNYKALVPMARNFSAGYEKAHGVKPGTRAGQICTERLT